MKYTTVYFDLDNTLLDFSAAQAGAIKKLLPLHGIEVKPEYISIYSDSNLMYWELFERGEIEREEIFEGRFKEFVRRTGIKADTAKMSKDYFYLLAEGHDVLPGAVEVLEYVNERGYIICATTNGIALTQHKRLKDSGLKKYFDYIFISEETGYQKPQKEYFDYVIDNTPEKDRSKILIIGDSLTSDISGGINSGIDTCWHNRKGSKSDIPTTYEISNIKELMSIL